MSDYRVLPGRVARISELMRTPGTKSKVSVTMSRGLLAAADDVAGEAGRSAFIERAVRRYLLLLVRTQRAARERGLLDQHADRLNAAAAEAQEDQATGADE